MISILLEAEFVPRGQPDGLTATYGTDSVNTVQLCVGIVHGCRSQRSKDCGMLQQVRRQTVADVSQHRTVDRVNEGIVRTVFTAGHDAICRIHKHTILVLFV